MCIRDSDSPDKAVELGLGFWWTIFDDQAINSSQKWNVEMNMKSNACLLYTSRCV